MARIGAECSRRVLVHAAIWALPSAAQRRVLISTELSTYLEAGPRCPVPLVRSVGWSVLLVRAEKVAAVRPGRSQPGLTWYWTVRTGPQQSPVSALSWAAGPAWGCPGVAHHGHARLSKRTVCIRICICSFTRPCLGA